MMVRPDVAAVAGVALPSRALVSAAKARLEAELQVCHDEGGSESLHNHNCLLSSASSEFGLYSISECPILQSAPSHVSKQKNVVKIGVRDRCTRV